MKLFILLMALCVTPSLFGQTNYPPNTAPWITNPTNWVFDCSFTGYGNVNPEATNLPCGWYDEITTVFPSSPPIPIDTDGFWIQLLSTTNVLFGRNILGNLFHQVVVLRLYNCVPGDTYQIYTNGNLSHSFALAVTVKSISGTNDVSLTLPTSDIYFFRAFGETLPPDHSFARLASFTLGLGLVRIFSRLLS
jgi:hypothetical protein